MTKVKAIRLAVIASAIIGSGVSITPAYAQTAYEVCVRDNCFGNYPNDPAGYRACVRWCANMYPPQL